MADALPRLAGRREAHKDATRAALRQAAQRLFSERGYEDTTVREISRAAGVNERTFYRYFEGKEGLLAEDTLAWIQALHDKIRDRPANEQPLRAVMLAMLELAHESRGATGPIQMWLFSSQPRPFAAIRRLTPRPLVRLERSIADAILQRTATNTSGSPATEQDSHAEFEAGVLARISTATLRSAVIHGRRIHANDDAAVAECFDSLLTEAFSIAAEHAQPSALATGDAVLRAPGRDH